MNANASDLEALEVEISRLERWRAEAAAADKVGTPEFMRTTLAHRALIDLCALDGGTPEQRAEVMRRLNTDTAS